MFPNSPNTKLKLLSLDNVQDSIGNRSLIFIRAIEVMGMSLSITSKEYYESKVQGFKIDRGVKIHSFLYDRSRYAEIDGIIYRIERTYQNGQFIELYLSETKLGKGDIIGYPG
jgi:hypothetical protein